MKGKIIIKGTFDVTTAVRSAAREAFLGTDTRTRVVPRKKKEKGGGRNWRRHMED